MNHLSQYDPSIRLTRIHELFLSTQGPKADQTAFPTSISGIVHTSGNTADPACSENTQLHESPFSRRQGEHKYTKCPEKYKDHSPK